MEANRTTRPTVKPATAAPMHPKKTIMLKIGTITPSAQKVLGLSSFLAMNECGSVSCTVYSICKDFGWWLPNFPLFVGDSHAILSESFRQHNTSSSLLLNPYREQPIVVKKSWRELKCSRWSIKTTPSLEISLGAQQTVGVDLRLLKNARILENKETTTKE